MKPVTVSTPGKLILMGEHAVVYGRPALVAAVDLRLAARLSPAAGPGVTLDLPAIASRQELPWPEVLDYAARARANWERWAESPGEEFRSVRGDDPAHVVKVALGETARFLGEADGPPLHLRIDSDLPVGSGFGSSAATAVGVIAGYLAYRSAEVEPGALHRLSLEVERRQHGSPSGVDSATVLHGGIVWARRAAGGGLEVERLAARSPLLGRLRVYDTGTPVESTGAVVAAVRARRDSEPSAVERLLDRLASATRAFRDEVIIEREDPERILGLIREAQSCLEELGVVPNAVRRLVRAIEAEGGAAKVSGAGALTGPAAGSLLVYHPDAERIVSWAFLRPYPFHPVLLGAAGYRREAA